MVNGLLFREHNTINNYEYEANCSSVWVAEGALSNVAPGESQSESEMCFLTEKIKERKLMIVLEKTKGKKRGLYYRRNRLRLNKRE